MSLYLIFSTRGFEQDEKNVEKIVGALKCVSHINVVMLVIPGVSPRAAVQFKYVMNRISSVLPASAQTNLAIMFTNCADSSLVSISFTSLKQNIGLNTLPYYFVVHTEPVLSAAEPHIAVLKCFKAP